MAVRNRNDEIIAVCFHVARRAEGFSEIFFLLVPGSTLQQRLTLNLNVMQLK